MEKLYENIGGKIKGLAKVLFVVDAISAIISGIACMFTVGFWVGLFVVILGPIVAWIATWMLYGWGELIDQTSINAENNQQILHYCQLSYMLQAKQLAQTPAQESTQNPVKAPAENPSCYPEARKETTDNGGTGDDTYVSGRTYYSGDRVKYQGVWYRCTASTSGTVWNPKQNPNQWKEISEQ